MELFSHKYGTRLIVISCLLLGTFAAHAQAPVANFTANVTEGCDFLIVNFTNTSTGANSYSWTFGDGTANSTVASPVHSFTTTGTFMVTLTARNAAGNSSTKSMPITVHKSPTADFTVSITEGCKPLNVVFTNRGTSTAPITNLEWSFGDGSVSNSTAATINHTYTAANTFTANLTMTDAHGCTASSRQPQGITVNPLPEPAFTPNPAETCDVPATVVFTSTTNHSSPITEYIWNFGDGSVLPSTGTTVQHEYTVEGFKTVSLSATDSKGCVGTTTTPNAVNVTKFEAEIIAPTNGLACVNEPRRFDSKYSQPGYTNTWYINDVQVGTAYWFSHTFSTVGTATVKLVSKNSAGCQAEIEQEIEIINTPQIAIASSDTDNHLCYDAGEHINTGYALEEVVNDAGLPFGNPQWRVYETVYRKNAAGQCLPVDTLIGTGNQTPISFSYPGEGQYSITLSAVDGACGQTRNAPPITVVVAQPPLTLTDLIWNDGYCFVDGQPFLVSGSAKSEVQKQECDNIIITDNNANITTWRWTIDDWKQGNQTISGQNLMYNFADTGRYNTTIRIEDIYGCTNTLDTEIDVGKQLENFDLLSQSPIICYKDDLWINFFDHNTVKYQWTELKWELLSETHGKNADGIDTITAMPFSEIRTFRPSEVVIYPKETREDSTGVFGYRVTPIQYYCESKPVYKLTAQEILPPVTKIQNPADPKNPKANFVLCDKQQYFTFKDSSIKVRSYEWDFNDGVTLTVDTVGSGDVGKERLWQWTATTDAALDALLDWRTLKGYAITNVPADVANNKPRYLKESKINTDVEYRYEDFGEYDVLIKTMNDTTKLDCGDEQYMHVTVTKVTPDISLSTNEVCTEVNFTITDASTDANGYQLFSNWKFDSGANSPVYASSDINRKATLALNAGIYTITQSVSNGVGCSETVTYTNALTVWKLPSVHINAPAHTCYDRNTSFKTQLEENSVAQESGVDMVSWKWHFFQKDTPIAGAADAAVQPKLVINKTATGYEWLDATGTVIVSDTTTKNPSPIFNRASANIYAWLQATDAHGCVQKDSVKIDVHAPRSSFELPHDVYCFYNEVQITSVANTGTANASLTQRKWDFGDGIGTFTTLNPTAQNPVKYTYPDDTTWTTDPIKDRSFVITLTTTENSPAQCTDVWTETVKISRPVSRIVPTTTYVECPTPPTNIGFSSTKSTTQIVAWAWDFKDGTPILTAANPSHIYHEPGQYGVSLKVTDTYGCIDSSIVKPYITVDGPNGKAWVSNTSVCLPFPVKFVPVAASIVNTVSARWVFGDGNAHVIDMSVMNDPIIYDTIVFNYEHGDTYIPVLELKDDKGCMHNVIAPAINAYFSEPDFQLEEPVACAQKELEFIDISTSSHPITDWAWRWENTNTGEYFTSTEQDPVIVLTYGNYNIHFTTKLGGCEYDILRDSAVQVYATPKADFRAFKDTVNISEGLVFTNTSIPSPYGEMPVHYSWDFDDGSSPLTSVNAYRAFWQEGVYNVQLSAYQHPFCIDIATKPIVVTSRRAIPNVFTPNSDGVNDLYLAGLGYTKIIIINRWGQTVYEGVDGWDGKVNSVEASPGTYFYLLTAPTGEVFKGALTLLRE
ncbi:MAG: PKD domain-containing protein [Bacteroidales bacterium]|nr:PKD domain-containing protein [Bacteroidales bacterium]